MTTIDREAFFDCRELTDVTCYAENVPSTDSNAFKNTKIENVTLHVPAASVNAYKTTEPWSGFKNIVGIDMVTKGDANSDQAVDVADVVAIVNFILGEPDARL